MSAMLARKSEGAMTSALFPAGEAATGRAGGFHSTW
jgi:hypothetical protein